MARPKPLCCSLGDRLGSFLPPSLRHGRRNAKGACRPLIIARSLFGEHAFEFEFAAAGGTADDDRLHPMFSTWITIPLANTVARVSHIQVKSTFTTHDRIPCACHRPRAAGFALPARSTSCSFVPLCCWSRPSDRQRLGTGALFPLPRPGWAPQPPIFTAGLGQAPASWCDCRGLANSAAATGITARPARARSVPDLVGADRLLRRQPLHIQPRPPSLGDDVEGNAVLALELGRDASAAMWRSRRHSSCSLPGCLPRLSGGRWRVLWPSRFQECPERIHRLPTRFVAPS